MIVQLRAYIKAASILGFLSRRVIWTQINADTNHNFWARRFLTLLLHPAY